MKVIEQLLTSAGISPIAGVDEAGRGACAGPLVIASVVLNDPFAPELAVVRDSKEIAEGKRDAIFDLIHQVAASVSVVIVPASEVDSRGVHAANLDGMRRAVNGLSISPAYVLTDGYAIEGHVPAADIKKLLAEKPDAVGLSVPAMPMGSPGMEHPDFPEKRAEYNVLLVKKNGAFSSYTHYDAIN